MFQTVRCQKVHPPLNPQLNPRVLIESGVPVVHLKIGECIFTREVLLISTVLGSCVSVTFHHAGMGIAAMFHALLPDAERMRRNTQEVCHFVDAAINRVIRGFARNDVPLDEVVVKLIGGANSMKTRDPDRATGALDVGRRNVEQARAVLTDLGLPPTSEHILGEAGRKVLFYTGTGDVWVRSIRHFQHKLEETLKQA